MMMATFVLADVNLTSKVLANIFILLMMQFKREVRTMVNLSMEIKLLFKNINYI